MAYTVEFAPAADRQFAKLAKQIQTRIFAAIEALRENPRPRGCMKMSGPQGYYRIRIGDHRVIYQIADDVKAAMTGLLEPVKEEVILGHANVKALFKYSKVGVIAGCVVKDGKMLRGAHIRIIREGKTIYEGRLDALKRFKEDAKEVLTGFECGISVSGFNDFAEGDTIECFEIRTAARKL